MKTVIFGGSGLIGDGFLQECLHADDVTQVLAVGRTPLELTHPKLRQVVHTDFLDFSSVEDDLADADACFWGLGVSSTGMEPEAYERITYGYTTAAARALHEVNPDLTFVYVSGGGTDSTGSGRLRWARVKGRTENAIVSTFPNGYALRPGFVLPAHKARSKTTAYRWAARGHPARTAPAAPSSGTGPGDRHRPARPSGTEPHPRGHVRHVLENREINSVAAL